MQASNLATPKPPFDSPPDPRTLPRSKSEPTLTEISCSPGQPRKFRRSRRGHGVSTSGLWMLQLWPVFRVFRPFFPRFSLGANSPNSPNPAPCRGLRWMWCLTDPAPKEPRTFGPEPSDSGQSRPVCVPCVVWFEFGGPQACIRSLWPIDFALVRSLLPFRNRENPRVKTVSGSSSRNNDLPSVWRLFPVAAWFSPRVTQRSRASHWPMV